MALFVIWIDDKLTMEAQTARWRWSWAAFYFPGLRKYTCGGLCLCPVLYMQALSTFSRTTGYYVILLVHITAPLKLTKKNTIKMNHVLIEVCGVMLSLLMLSLTFVWNHKSQAEHSACFLHESDRKAFPHPKRLQRDKTRNCRMKLWCTDYCLY